MAVESPHRTESPAGKHAEKMELIISLQCGSNLTLKMEHGHPVNFVPSFNRGIPWLLMAETQFQRDRLYHHGPLTTAEWNRITAALSES